MYQPRRPRDFDYRDFGRPPRARTPPRLPSDFDDDSPPHHGRQGRHHGPGRDSPYPDYGGTPSSGDSGYVSQDSYSCPEPGSDLQSWGSSSTLNERSGRHASSCGTPSSDGASDGGYFAFQPHRSGHKDHSRGSSGSSMSSSDGGGRSSSSSGSSEYSYVRGRPRGGHHGHQAPRVESISGESGSEGLRYGDSHYTWDRHHDGGGGRSSGRGNYHSATVEDDFDISNLMTGHKHQGGTRNFFR